ncbi:zinc ribbon domain-containing protein [Paucisalibacillus sp. EB02]|uniref:zinc ribbon domain-containing protein n=1 Tax=Paucisalibacillus sp. EB02 TaxID=1347087 RepID=UPI0005A75F4F|nr:hypothetical protein [Paucisalibacillus sp. EB02]
MKCNHCKHKLSSKDIKFCPECGNEIEIKSSKKRPRKIIWGVSLSLLVIISMITLYVIGDKKFDPTLKLNAFETAITSGDRTTLAEILVPFKDSFEINEENVTKLIEFYQENPAEFQSTLEKLKNELDGQPSDTSNYATIQFEKDGKNWLVFDNYKLVVVPAFIEVVTPDNGIDILIDGEKVDTTGEEGFHQKTYGPYMPGKYDVKALFDINYASTELSQETTLFNMDSNSTKHEMDLSVGTIRIISTFEEDATLVVNDNKTDIIINKGNQIVGPFPLDQNLEMHLEKEMPWETVISDSITVSEAESEYSIQKVLTVSEEEVDKIITIINDVFTTYTEAVTKRDASILENHITDNFKEKLEEQITKVEKDVPDYEGKLLKSQYRVNWIEDPAYKEDLGVYEFDIDVMFTYYEPNGSLGRLFEGDNEHEYERGLNVVLLYNEEENDWFVDRYTMEHFFVYDEDPLYEFD